MRVAARHHGLVSRPRIEVGSVVAGHLVDDWAATHAVGELRYAVRSMTGEHATLVVPARRLDRRERAEFRRRAALFAALDHPALIAVRDFGEDLGDPYVIADPYPSQTLGSLLGDALPLDPEWVVAKLAPVAEALDLARAGGLLHRGLTTDSLMIDASARLVLDAFGFVAVDETTPWSTSALGDIRYMAPEQARGEEEPEHARTVYALAAIALHALTGSPAYEGQRPAVTTSHLLVPPPRASERVPELDPRVDEAIARGMAKEPRDRPDSARELLLALADGLGVDVPSIATYTDDSHAAGQAPGGHPRVVAPRLPSSAPRRVEAGAPTRGRRGLAVASAAVAIAAVCGAVAASTVDPFGGGSTASAVPALDAATWQRLADRRTELRAELAAADTPQEQAAIASRLAAAHLAAAGADGPARLRDAARDTGGAYADLASAAEAGDEAAFASASTALAPAEGRLAAQLR